MKCSGDLGEDAHQLAHQRVMILASCPSIQEEERLLTFEWVNIALLYIIINTLLHALLNIEWCVPNNVDKDPNAWT